MKKLLFLLSLTLFYHADATGFQQNFSKDGTATQWTMIQYKNYKPFPKIIQHKEKGFLHISDIRGKSGFGIANHVKKVKAYSPDRIRVRFTAKGKENSMWVCNISPGVDLPGVIPSSPIP